MHSRYPMLFSPLKVNKVVLKNRIISAPLGSNTDKSLSGIGMIIRGTSGSVDDSRMRLAPGPYCFKDLFTAAKVRDEVRIIRQAGAKAEFELCHCGQFAMVEPGDYAIGPVSFTRKDGTEVRAMDEAMMADIAAKYAKSACDAKEYGFDSVLIHFAHGWLPGQFLSPHFNKRTDGYGGSFENRIKFPIQIVEAIRKAVGPDYMLDMRISGNEHVGPDGMPIEEVAEFIRRIEHLIDMVHISCGSEVDVRAKSYMSSTAYLPHMINVDDARTVKEKVSIPVAVVGGIMTPEEAESVLESGAADAVVVGRQLIADPWWVRKAWEGRSEDITPCIRCMNCYNPYQYHTKEELEAHVGLNTVPCCSVNPRYLHEDRVPNKVPLAETKKRVVVVGGGPAGMKAAITAAQRGHETILLEKGTRLGGQLCCADFDEMKQDLRRYKDFLVRQIGKAGVKTHLATAATPDLVRELAPDALILALGAYPSVFPIRGLENIRHLTALEAFEHADWLGRKIAIVGGGSIGCELGVFLAQRGREVSIIEAGPRLNRTLNDIMRASLAMQMEACSTLAAYTDSQVQEISDGGVVVSHAGETLHIEADTLIFAAGMKSRIDESNEFYGICQDTIVIGDANRVGTVWTATEDGYYAAAHL